MKLNRFKHFFLFVILFLRTALYSFNTSFSAYDALPELVSTKEDLQKSDSLPPLRYPVAKIIPEEYKDIVTSFPAGFNNPDNIKTTIEYDLNNGSYIVRTRLGNMNLGVPMTLTPKEYQDYSLQKSLQSYFRQKNEEEYHKAMNEELNLTGTKFDIPAIERIFGPGGVRIRAQGSAEINLGVKRNSTNNPSLPERSRTGTFFSFDESVQLNVRANVGTKVDFNMNYNTETSFDFDSKRLKLTYTGEEDEIIKSIEAGNVNMNTGNSLINGGAALFGMRADLQFGKLRVNALLAQQNSQTKTVSSKGGVQTQSFEFSANLYDENKHFFLAHYFRDIYDEAMQNLPNVNTGIKINRIEVWKTNKRGSYDLARNIVAFSDLAEQSHISNNNFSPSSSLQIPQNNANTLYNTITTQYAGMRNINQVTQTMAGFIEEGVDYEKTESARLLESSEYSLNSSLGYISLKAKLQQDEVLAVAFEYTYRGQTYKVGEFSTDDSENTNNCLYVKLLKGTTMSPQMIFWNLMMKNVYSLNTYSVKKEDFRLDILYQSDTTGTYLNYIKEGNIANTPLLKAMNLDRLNQQNQTFPDGFFDFVEGYTILSETGKIVFPVVEPFGSHLKKAIGNNAVADKYMYQELYDMTLTEASRIAEKNKFVLRGKYQASNAAIISLGASNVAQGSVRVTSGGIMLTENVDYTVDYMMGQVIVINESIISTGQAVSVSLEDQSLYGKQRKTMMGVDLNYEVNKNFNIGTTIIHLSEMPLTNKTSFGDESVRNTLWGLNTSYNTESQLLTNLADKLPLLTLTKPSRISFNAEFAHLIAGHYENGEVGKYSYIDDFESTQNGFDLANPFAWQLASTPYDGNMATSLFPEASLINDINYGKNRALLAWYCIDGIFTRAKSTQKPAHIDDNQRSNHYMRAVKVDEIFPNKDLGPYTENALQVLNLAYYPKERGPYNLDADKVNADGTLTNPESRWGGIMRRLDQTDFETANIEYLEFWVMDPFIYNNQAKGGDLYFNLGDISEDILKDGKKFFENGLPADPSDLTKFEKTKWGKVPTIQSTVYAFDNTSGLRERQDVGLNGLSSEEEKSFDTYVEYLDKLRAKLSGEAISMMEQDPFSPFNDPAGDTYSYFRSPYYDSREADILTRYKRYNGTEGNSVATNGTNYSTASKALPDVEDLNQDNTLNESERYFQYKISLRPKDLEQVGANHIVNKRTTRVRLANGSEDSVTWYQFKVPIREYAHKVGSINDFKTIRFMRMFMTGFKDETVLRFGKLQLVRGDWRTYTQGLSKEGTISSKTGELVVSTVNYEENGDKQPVNYVLPPGVSRTQDPGQSQIYLQNEQSLSLKVTNLASQDALAVYKNTSYDLRNFKRMQMFTHAEALEADPTGLESGDMSVFIRLGSDYKNNYYEYEVPLTLTPHGQYGSSNREIVWPAANMLDFPLEVFTDLKLKRNKAQRENINGVSYQKAYSEYDPSKPQNKVGIVGNPNLAEIKTIMIGVRNNSKDSKNAEIWINELRLTDFDEKGGWAANANLNVMLSDFGTVNIAGRMQTVGFGALDQSVSERSMEDNYGLNVSTSMELGKFFPEKSKISIPVYYSYSKDVTTPKYNPLDKDMELDEASLNLSQDITTSKAVSFNNVRVNIKSETSMPYDPANFSLSYSYRETDRHTPEVEYETIKDYSGSFSYSYTPNVRPFRPFEKLKRTPYTQYLKQLSINYLPTSVSFQTNMVRNYYETQARDIENEGSMKPVFSQNWDWERRFSLMWNLMENLGASLQTGTNAKIEEPYMQVNKRLNPDQYQVWKDSVMQSIQDMGTPMKYDQTFNLTYAMPFKHIPALNWITTTATYNATYIWDKVAAVNDNETGNTIKNQRAISTQTGLNLLSLYNKNSYLKKINQKPTQNIFESLTRFAMMLRRINVQYSRTDGMLLPGFRPEAGDIFGQKKYSAGMAPGLGFAFGSVKRSYIDEAYEKDWLVINENFVAPAIISRAKRLDIRATLEPVIGFKIELNANRVDTRSTEIMYMHKGMPELYGGNFLMTTITISTAFQGIGNQANGYSSKAFNQFLKNRDVIATRLEQRYTGIRYPDKGFLEETPNAGHPYNPSNGSVKKNSADVLIPAFLAAYTGQDVDDIALTAFPSLKKLLPNWRVTYDGIPRLFPIIKERFKSIVLSHQYRSSYNVGSFSSFSDWTSAGGGLGFLQSNGGEILPSSPYLISSVSIAEGFTPLFGVDAVMLNNMTAKIELRKIRTINLNISSYQLIESASNETVLGVGYKLTEFNKVLGMTPAKNYSNDLALKFDFSYRKTQALIRKIEEAITQPTSGNIAKTLQLSADYGISRSLSLRAFYDLQINAPLISNNSYPSSNSYYGVSIRFSLT